jgi:D-alanyl-lipoteichoic acid acyltransferase DltB (MBOAT superfamily)
MPVEAEANDVASRIYMVAHLCSPEVIPSCVLSFFFFSSCTIHSIDSACQGEVPQNLLLLLLVPIGQFAAASQALSTELERLSQTSTPVGLSHKMSTSTILENGETNQGPLHTKVRAPDRTIVTSAAVPQAHEKTVSMAFTFGSEVPRWKFFRVEYSVAIVFTAYMTWWMWKPLRELSVEHNMLLKSAGVITEPWHWMGKLTGNIGVDRSDHQWREFFFSLPLLTLGMGLFVGLSQLARKVGGPVTQRNTRLVCGLAFLLYLHGIGASFVMLFLLVNYFMAFWYRYIPTKILLPGIWAIQISALFVIERFKGQHQFERMFGPKGAWIDTNYQGALSWYVIFNMNTLRMISFDYDVAESAKNGAVQRAKAFEKHESCLECAMEKSACYKLRSDACQSLSQYTLANYLTYMLYPPLYIAGPMSSFNAFVSHMHSPQKAVTGKALLKYIFVVVRLIFYLELMMHFVHLNAFRAEVSRSYSVLARRMDWVTMLKVGQVALAFLWLKFSIFWKYFRTVSLLDGVGVPEDMKQCFSNVNTVADFWQNWHTSFNAWIVRYMYIPMGGAKTRIFTALPIFGFIALWHDIQLHLFLWAVMMCGMLIVEGLGIAYFSSKRFTAMHQSPFWRGFRTLGAVVPTTALIVANAVGFGGSLDSPVPFPFGPKSTAVLLVVYYSTGSYAGILDRDNRAWKRRMNREYYLGSSSGKHSIDTYDILGPLTHF